MEISGSHVLENLTPNPSPEREGSNENYRLSETLCLSAFVAKNNRAFAPLRALRETILRGKIIREFVAASLIPRRGIDS